MGQLLASPRHGNTPTPSLAFNLGAPMNIQSTAFEFERLLARILRQEGYLVTENYRPSGAPYDVDLLASRDDVVIPVELKFTTQPVGLRQLRQWGPRVAVLAKFARRAKPVLAIGGRVNPVHRTWAETEYDILIWDAADLLHLAGELGQELETLLARHPQRTSVLDMAPEEVEQRLRALGYIVDAEQPPEAEPAPPMGDGLVSRLRNTLTGKSHAKAYEEICRDIIAYVFGQDLLDGRSQKRTTDSINVYDLIYRVAPHNAFWSTLTRDFRARVVMFECKNYTHPIRAMQIFTTERYLSTNVLRPICFILTRKAPHQHAVNASFGAMRDAQKLLVVLSDEDLIAMIRAKDAQLVLGGTAADRIQNDPTEILDQRIYDFIAGIPR